ncbi:ABC transporter substrate-binding protein [Oscillospiraceae bacterium MB08-C2-2]|nr:ABC transporter substrate-binding protein [Oscillospiraceae bacterium MB08-C2-2]
MKKATSTLLALALVLGLTACGTTASSNPSSTSPTAASSQSTDGGAEKTLKIGFAQVHTTNNGRIAQSQDMRDIFGAAGLDIVITDANNDTNKQNADVEDLLAQGIDYLILCPKEEEGLVPALDAAKKAGVPVILIDRTSRGVAGEDYLTAIRSNAIAQGEWCAEWLAKQTDGKCNVVEIFGSPGSTTAMDRSNGFKKVMEEHPDMVLLASQVGNNMRTEAQAAMEAMIQAHGDKIDAVYTHNDEMTFGAIQGIKSMGLTPGTDILVLSVGDGSNDMLEAINGGEVAACSQNNMLYAQQCLEVILAAEAGDTIEPLVWSNDTFYTKENVEQYLGKNW